MSKKFISLILCFVLLSAFVPAAFAEDEITDVCTQADINNAIPLENGSVALLSEEESALLEAAEQLRAAMVNRESPVTVSVPYYSSNTRSDSREIFRLAVAHTGNPKEGDYIYRQFSKYTSHPTRYRNPDRTTWEYTIEYRTTAEQEKEVDIAVEKLLQELGVRNMKSDYEKVRAIYDWICEHVVYDYEHLNDDSYQLQFSAYAALIGKKAVCQGYATLLYRLLLECGIDCREISGIGNGGPHAWNIVKLDGKYYNLDSTWDAGRGSYGYFLTNMENFVDHERDEDYTSDEFNELYPMSEYDYWESIPSGTIGSNITWVVDQTGTLTITGSGAMPDYDDPDSVDNASPFCNKDFTLKIKKIVISGNITHVGDFTFYWLFNVNEVVLPEGLESIGQVAFWQCREMKSITLPKSLKTVGALAFGLCDSLQNIYYTGSIDDWARITIDRSYESNDVFFDSGLQIHYDYQREPEPEMKNPVINSVDANLIDGAVIVFIDAENVPEGAVFAAAGYSAEGELLGISRVDNGSALLDENSKTVKVFIIDSFGSLKPLAEYGEADLAA